MKKTLTQRVTALERKVRALSLKVEVLEAGKRKFMPSENMDGPKPTTILGWLETLPEPVRAKALANLLPNHANMERDKLSWAIHGAFVWHETREGHDYWREQYRDAVDLERQGV
jgi:hypothetical protein